MYSIGADNVIYNPFVNNSNWMADIALYLGTGKLPESDEWRIISVKNETPWGSPGSISEQLVIQGENVWLGPWYGMTPFFSINPNTRMYLTQGLLVCPLVLDLDGDCAETTNVNDRWVMFDLDGDGVKNRTGWANSDDGFLVFDRNGDGIINDGREMFGNY